MPAYVGGFKSRLRKTSREGIRSNVNYLTEAI
jgi:hypothetical protein